MRKAEGGPGRQERHQAWPGRWGGEPWPGGRNGSAAEEGSGWGNPVCRVRRAGLNGVCGGVLSLREWKRSGEPPLDQKGGLRVGLGWEFLSEGRSGAGWAVREEVGRVEDSAG